MFGIGGTELLVILVVALIVLGPKSLAGVSRSLGKAMGEFRRVSTEFQRALNVEAAQAEEKEKQSAKKRTDETGNIPPSSSQTVNLPEDSPVAQALKKAQTEADKTSNA